MWSVTTSGHDEGGALGSDSSAPIAPLRLPREVDLSSALARPSGFTVFRDGAEVPPDQRPLHRAARGETVTNELLEIRFDGGERRMLLLRAAPLRNKAGELQGAVCAAADVTERHRHEDHLKLLLNELNHRVKNTLATVQSFAVQTLRTAPTIADGRRAFEARLIALSKGHDVLTRENWQGAGLHEVVEQEGVGLHRAVGHEYLLDGHVVLLGDPLAQRHVADRRAVRRRRAQRLRSSRTRRTRRRARPAGRDQAGRPNRRRRRSRT